MVNTTDRIDWKLSTFKRLDIMILYKILQLRSEVFIVEQTCYYQDLDDKDEGSLHLMGWDRGHLVAYSRLLPKGISYPMSSSIGRVVTHSDYRGQGLGKELMQLSIKHCEEQWPGDPIKISAQTYLKEFYEDFGFTQCGEGYLEDGIPHIPMIRTPQ